MRRGTSGIVQHTARTPPPRAVCMVSDTLAHVPTMHPPGVVVKRPSHVFADSSARGSEEPPAAMAV